MTTCTPPCPGIVQLEIVFKLDGQVVENVMHYDTTLGATVPADRLLAIANAADAQVPTGPWHLMGPGLVYQFTKARDLTPGSGGDSQVSVAHAGAAGADAAQMFPNNAALACTLHTSAGGRSGRGRIYLMGLTVTGLVTQNQYSAVRIAQFKANLDSFIAGTRTAAAPGDFGVLSKWHNKVCRPAGVFHALTATSIDSTMDSQRRRLPGRGK